MQAVALQQDCCVARNAGMIATGGLVVAQRWRTPTLWQSCDNLVLDDNRRNLRQWIIIPG